ncbi:carboxypeptidase-like regulatory domain-containing protein, partial [Salmonella enterica subsp. enterica serovar Minnesota]|uniref:carboxypeptidase-like regulatory domain-containing protein n=1 Tax=Salmonella enterica TaxID=28901 RepID=UPI003D2BF1FB
LPVSGIVWDSVASVPLAGAAVQFAGQNNPSLSFNATTDSLGQYLVPAVPPGRYLVGFFHPSLDALGI